MDAHVIAAIAERFPEARGEIETLAESDVEFSTLCEDFALARAAMLTAESGEQGSDPERRDEYRALLDELAEAIAEAFGRSKAVGHSKRQ